jgi:hypothetical protein
MTDTRHDEEPEPSEVARGVPGVFLFLGERAREARDGDARIGAGRSPRHTHPSERAAERASERERRLRALGREVVCLRAACASAGPLRRWWLSRRLRAVEREMARLAQPWRRRNA